MNTTTVSIQGMHCKSCELLIEDELKKIKNVSSVAISHKTGLATVTYDGGEIEKNVLQRAVHNAGYKLGAQERLPLFSKTMSDYVQLFFAAVVLGLLYLIGQELGIFNIALTKSNNLSSMPVVLMIGITAGLSTCMALVGGLVLGIASRYAQMNPQASIKQKFIPHIFFNMGRVVSFFILGGIIGAVGSVFQLTNAMTGILIIAVSLVMILLGMQLIHIMPVLDTFALTLPKGISKALGITTHQNATYSHKSALLMGALTFFIPCGFTQAVQLYAMTTGSFLAGAITMGIFALGTIPGLLSLAGFASIVKQNGSGLFFKFVGLVVVTLAIFNISNGLTLAGFQMHKTAATSTDPHIQLVNGVQVIHMEQNETGYTPNTFTIKKNVPVKWIIKSVYPSCASSLVVQKLNIHAFLTQQEQTFTFTARDVGEIPFTCSMGMYSGSITVVE